MARLGPRQRHERAEKRKAWAISTVAAVLLVMIIALITLAVCGNEAIDHETLCLEGAPPQEFWAVLVDVTDELNPVQREALRQRFENLKASVPKGAMLALFRLSDAEDTALEPLVALCNPGSGEELSMLTSNPELARKKWEEQFVRPVDAVLDTVLVSESLPRSPIMEAIRNVKVASDTYDSPERRVIIFSDMMQHSPTFSHYARGDVDFEAVPTYELSAVRVDLTGWDIYIHYLRRRDSRARQVQGKSHITFWDHYFRNMGGTVQEVIAVEG